MDINDAMGRLEQLNALYEGFAADRRFACRKGCAHCCTANVTITTLEAKAILKYWASAGRMAPMGSLRRTAGRPRFQPRITINRLAAICAAGGDPPEEIADSDVDACPMLESNICTIYAVRPFGCRAMVSLTQCAPHGAADMPDGVLAANTLLQQCIEAMDARGFSGNLTDVLLWLLASPGAMDQWPDAGSDPPAGLVANRSIPVLMIPPEQRDALMPLLQSLRLILTHL